ncbi:hypothetical protein GCM10020221_01760 [Streptomyces thioluteus]|uniref:Uncharacterized protein n=1 Tax=Streptomyces thioluteus TaxID=66431 RepID=A0ABN3WCF2_STRTU
MAWANDVPAKAATYPLSRSVATEFVVTSVTADNLDDTLHALPAATAIKAANRHVKWVDVTPPPAEAGGFSLCRVGVATDQPGP